MSKDRLTDLQKELSSILEERLRELSGAMHEAEQVTRQIVSAELEIRQHQDRSGEFRQEMDHGRVYSLLDRYI